MFYQSGLRARVLTHVVTTMKRSKNISSINLNTEIYDSCETQDDNQTGDLKLSFLFRGLLSFMVSIQLLQ